MPLVSKFSEFLEILYEYEYEHNIVTEHILRLTVKERQMPPPPVHQLAPPPTFVTLPTQVYTPFPVNSGIISSEIHQVREERLKTLTSSKNKYCISTAQVVA